MPRSRVPRAATIAVALLVALVLAGCGGGVSVEPPAPTAPPPTPGSTATVVQWRIFDGGPLVPTAIPRQPSPTPDLALAALTDPEPAPATLTSGATTQTGAHGYAVWCRADGGMAIYDTFGRVSVPGTVLIAPQGGDATFSYLGADPLRLILAKAYPADGMGTPNPPGQFTIPREESGTVLLVARHANRAAITLALPAGDYVLFVNALHEGVPRLQTCGAQYQFRVRVA